MVHAIGLVYVYEVASAPLRRPLPSTVESFEIRTRLRPLPLSVAGTDITTFGLLVVAAPPLIATLPEGGVESDAGRAMKPWRENLRFVPALLSRLVAVAAMPLADVTSCFVVDASSMSVSLELLMNVTPRFTISSAGPRKS